MQEWLVEWQATRMFPVLTVEHSTEKIAVVPDNARPHHAKALTGLYEPGQPLERITPIHLPPYAPDHNPV
ncbi:MAG: transposase, partial [Pauljensenia sp.]